LFLLARRAFYAEDFEAAKKITQGIDTAFLPPAQAKDTKAFHKYSRLYSSIAGPLIKKILSHNTPA
jgi:hypothetical protein